MLAFVVHFRQIIALILSIILSLWLYSKPIESRIVIAHGVQVSLLAPIQYIFNKTTRINNIFAENKRVLKENAYLNLELQRKRDVFIENSTLRKMLDFKEISTFELIPVENIARSPGILSKNIIISAGQNLGIKRNMPAITVQGLIGKVLESYPFNSNIQLLTDPYFRVSVILRPSQSYGILTTLASGNTIVELRTHTKVSIGDTVSSSGMGGIFPRDLLIGTVNKIDQKNELFKTISVKLHTEVNSPKNLFIIKTEHFWESLKDSTNAK